MDRNDIKTTKDQVEYILTKLPNTRDSDKWLTIELWKEFYPQLVWLTYKREPAITLESIMDLPSQDAIKRVRAQIQNDEKRLLPTSWEVAKERNWLETEWRAALGYPTDAAGQGRLF